MSKIPFISILKRHKCASSWGVCRNTMTFAEAIYPRYLPLPAIISSSHSILVRLTSRLQQFNRKTGRFPTWIVIWFTKYLSTSRVDPNLSSWGVCQNTMTFAVALYPGYLPIPAIISSPYLPSHSILVRLTFRWQHFNHKTRQLPTWIVIWFTKYL